LFDGDAAAGVHAVTVFGPVLVLEQVVAMKLFDAEAAAAVQDAVGVLLGRLELVVQTVLT
jgi:hypothetical protein